MIKTRYDLSLVILIFGLFCIIPVVADTWEDYWSPWVTNTSTSSASINWRQATEDASIIAYANESYYSQYKSFDKILLVQNVSNFYHVLLSELEPNTTYKYLVTPSGNPDAFNIRSFRTFPVQGQFTFIVLSDSQKGHTYNLNKRFKYVAEAVAKEQDVLFILHGGDYYGYDYQEGFAMYYHDADTMLANTTIFPTIGNHEYHDPINPNNSPTAAVYYHSSYDMPLNYSFDCANVRFISLNTPDPENSNEDDPHTSAALALSQVPWLRERLNNDMAGTFTIHHNPIWDNNRTTIDDNLSSWESLYHTYNISANFAGHTHNYQRFMVEGIPYFISGNAGGRCADITNLTPIGYQYGATRELGYLKVRVDPANNTASAQEIFVASVQEDDSNETPSVYTHPIIADTISFPLKPPHLSALDFFANQTTGTPPLAVLFTGRSAKTARQWNWSFGDGSTSTQQNPVHVYRGIGRYTVTLQVSSDSETEIIRKPVYVETTGNPNAGPHGMLWITSTPLSASVYVDGINIGTTPLQYGGIRAGIRQLRVAKEGYGTWAGYVQIRQGQMTYVPNVVLHIL